MIPSSISGYLDRNQTRYAVLPHPIAYTAQEEAAATHVPGSEWAKSVVCIADNQPVLAVLPAPCAVDLDRLQRVLNAHSLRLAKEAELAELYKDCEVGAMPPFGPLYGQRVIVDTALTMDPEIAFNAGSHHDAIRMAYGEFERLVHPAVADFATGPVRSTRSTMVVFTDPVCGTQIEKHNAAGRSELGDETYYFCSLSCKMEFDDNPRAYLRE
jgi:Ala-tRNA(Pro) deacylase